MLIKYNLVVIQPGMRDKSRFVGSNIYIYKVLTIEMERGKINAKRNASG